MERFHVTPAEEGEHNFVSLRRFFYKIKLPFVNGDTSGPVELISMPLEHKLYVGEGIRSILGFSASIDFSKIICDERFGEKLVENEHFPL